jgi:hypothetical protein
MFLLQSLQAPFPFMLARQDNSGVPEYIIEAAKYTLDEGIAWGAVLAERARTKQKEGLNAKEQRDFDIMYPPYPLSLGDIKRALLTPEGAKEVVGVCMDRAKVWNVKLVDKIEVKLGRKFKVSVPEKGEPVTDAAKLQEIKSRVLNGNGTGALTQLAWELADIHDLTPEAPIVEELTDEQKEQGKDPLPLTGKGD